MYKKKYIYGICKFCKKKSRISTLGVINHLTCIKKANKKHNKKIKD